MSSSKPWIANEVVVKIKNRSDVRIIVYDSQLLPGDTGDIDDDESFQLRDVSKPRRQHTVDKRLQLGDAATHHPRSIGETLRDAERRLQAAFAKFDVTRGIEIPANSKVTLRRFVGQSLRFWTADGKMAFAEYLALNADAPQSRITLNPKFLQRKEEKTTMKTKATMKMTNTPKLPPPLPPPLPPAQTLPPPPPAQSPPTPPTAPPPAHSPPPPPPASPSALTPQLTATKSFSFVADIRVDQFISEFPMEHVFEGHFMRDEHGADDDRWGR